VLERTAIDRTVARAGRIKEHQKWRHSALRTALARKTNPPLVALQEAPAVTTELTFTVTDWLALPPAPLQLSV
jgi:hypothetical protein